MCPMSFRCDRPPYRVRRWSRGPRSQSLDVVLQGQLKAQHASSKPPARWRVNPEDLQAMLDARDGRSSCAAPELESV
jgi:hypothetical protein